MNYIQLLSKLGLYQQKVFIRQWFKVSGTIKTENRVNSLYTGGYLFKWQRELLLDRNYKKLFNNMRVR